MQVGAPTLHEVSSPAQSRNVHYSVHTVQRDTELTCWIAWSWRFLLHIHVKHHVSGTTLAHGYRFVVDVF